MHPKPTIDNSVSAVFVAIAEQYCSTNSRVSVKKLQHPTYALEPVSAVNQVLDQRDSLDLKQSEYCDSVIRCNVRGSDKYDYYYFVLGLLCHSDDGQKQKNYGADSPAH